MPITPSFGRFETLASVFARGRVPLPTSLGSAELRELDAAIRRQSVFSARMTNAQAVQSVKDLVERLLGGEVNTSTAVAELQRAIDLLGYDPARGFPGDDPNIIPPAEANTLRDLASERRTKLILETQERMAANYGTMRAGMEDAERYQFPAWELVRIYDRREPRGVVHAEDSWPRRWVRAGGSLIGGERMIATKDDEIWARLGSSALFDDGLDNPYPPFAFQSGFGWRAVPREEAVALGVIQEDEIPEWQDPGFGERLQLNAAAFDPDILQALQHDLERELQAA